MKVLFGLYTVAILFIAIRIGIQLWRRREKRLWAEAGKEALEGFKLSDHIKLYPVTYGVLDLSSTPKKQPKFITTKSLVRLIDKYMIIHGEMPECIYINNLDYSRISSEISASTPYGKSTLEINRVKIYSSALIAIGHPIIGSHQSIEKLLFSKSATQEPWYQSTPGLAPFRELKHSPVVVGPVKKLKKRRHAKGSRTKIKGK